MIHVKKLLEKHKASHSTSKPSKLYFKGINNLDVYNITAPFLLNGTTILAGRVEARDSEQSKIGLFEASGEQEWTLINEAIMLDLQDPFVSIIEDKVILGGVEVLLGEENNNTTWRTVLYHLASLNSAEKIFEGPIGMKDLRLKQLPDKRILVLTRPQGVVGGRGKIGATTIDCLAMLSIEQINNAPLLDNQFGDEDWGGANEIHLIGEKICVLGHIAQFDEKKDRHYYALTFELDQSLRTMLHPQIIAERSDFLAGPTKRPDLTDVVFSGGLQFEGDSVILYAGISDAEAQKITIKNPF